MIGKGSDVPPRGGTLQQRAKLTTPTSKEHPSGGELTRVHCPVTADDKLIRNSFGIIVATTNHQDDAYDIATLINLGADALSRIATRNGAKR